MPADRRFKRLWVKKNAAQNTARTIRVLHLLCTPNLLERALREDMELLLCLRSWTGYATS
eukprot:775609-Lingulodinium_polyedra.AAC.1